MDTIQKQLDTDYIIKQFGQHINDNGNATDLVFDDIKGLYIWGELEYKYLCAARISSAPSHSCTRDTCVMKKVPVVVYRKIKYGAGIPPQNTLSHAQSTIDMGFGDSTRVVSYHVCFTDECVHLKTSHYCEEPSECPHSTRYEASNTRTLSDFWACASTGNVHMCGVLCRHQKIVTQYENDFVCMLTGTVVSRNISHEQNDQYVSKMITGVEAYVQETPLASTTGRGRRRMTRAKSSACMWEDPEHIQHNRMEVANICEDLLFSHERQMLEASSVVREYEHAYIETIRALTIKRPDGTPINVGHAMCVFKACSGSNAYFNNVPMRPEIKTYIHRELANIDGTYTIQHAVPQTQVYTDARMTMYATVEKYRSTHGHICRQDMQWDSGEWKNAMQNVKDMFAFTLVNVWANLNKHHVRTGDETIDNDADFTNFKRLILPLLYMTRRKYALCDQTHLLPNHPFATTNANTTHFISVIPMIDFAVLLPPENKLEKFSSATSTANNTAQQQAGRRIRTQHSSHDTIFLRKMTSTQTTIKKTFDRIAKDGKLTNIQLTIEDVCAQILKINTNKE